MGGTIFISYRRGRDAGFAGRLSDRLKKSFGHEQVFMDVDNIPLGEDFVAVLESRVAACDVLLALIGPDWLAPDVAGHRRLDNPDDYVRIEIAAALAQGKRVIPVVIDNVAVPQKEELPEEISLLARRQAFRLRHDRFTDDATSLVIALEKALGGGTMAGQVEAGGLTKVEEEDQLQSARKCQRAEAEAERQAEEKDRRQTGEEAKRQSEAEKPKSKVLMWIKIEAEKPKSKVLTWIIGGPIILLVLIYHYI